MSNELSPEMAQVPQAVEQRAEQLENLLDEYEGQLALPAYQVTSMEHEAKKILTLTKDQLQKMTPVECGEAAYSLSRFAFFLQRSVNREQARANWAKESISRLTAKVTLGISNYYHRDERLAFAVANDDAAKKYDQIRVHAESRIKRLDYLSGKIQDVAKTLMSLQHSKKGNRD